MDEPIDTLIIKTVELWNDGHCTTLEQGLIYPLPVDIHHYVVRYGYGLPYKTRKGL